MSSPRKSYLYPLPSDWDADKRAALVLALPNISDDDIIDNESRVLTGKIDGALEPALILIGVDLPYGPDDITAALA